MQKIAINPGFLPSPEAAFNRASEVKLGKYTLLLISGTASVGAQLQTMYPGDFKAQIECAYSNIYRILQSRGFAVKDVIRWRVYLKDIKKYYVQFNLCRNEFFCKHSIARSDFGASVCVEAKLCRNDLLVEIEADALRGDPDKLKNNKK